MFKKIIFIIFLLLPLALLAKNDLQRVDSHRQQIIISRINQSTSAINTICCDFEQTKFLSLLDDKLESSGKMYFKQPQNLKWEYVNPYKYVFIISESKVSIRSMQGVEEIDVRSSRLFQEIVNIMVNSVTGKCLSDDSYFDIAMYDSDKALVARLIPRKKEVKRIFNVIMLYFDKETFMLSKVEMEEENGDLTRISLKNVEVNVHVDDKVFSLD